MAGGGTPFVKVWRLIAPLLFLAAVVGVVSLVALSGAFSRLESPPAPAPTTSQTLVLPLATGQAPETPAGSDAAGASDTAPAGADGTTEAPSDGSGD